MKNGSWLVIAKTGKVTCPVKYLNMYLSAFKIPHNSDEFIFRKVSFLKKSDSYVLRKGDHISYNRAREILLENLRKIGLDSSKFGMHSLRSGGATQVANCGFVCDRLFKKHGRWRSDSAKDGYVKEKDEVKRSVSLNLENLICVYLFNLPVLFIRINRMVWSVLANHTHTCRRVISYTTRYNTKKYTWLCVTCKVLDTEVEAHIHV